jgi:hypothetical protein
LSGLGLSPSLANTRLRLARALAGASVWVRFPSSDEIARIAHYERGYRVGLHSMLVLTIARRRTPRACVAGRDVRFLPAHDRRLR